MNKRAFKLPDLSGTGSRNDSVRETARSFLKDATTNEKPPGVDSTPDEVSTRVKQIREVTTGPTSRLEGLASWRKPRADGRLRTNDRLILDYLRERIVDEATATTDEVSMKEIAAGCGVSHRTAQNTVQRMMLAKVVTRFEQRVGSNSGCRYRILHQELQTQPAK